MLVSKNPFRNKEEQFITALEQFWNQYGNLPTAQKLIDLNLVKDLAEYESLLSDDFVQKALNQLGINLDPNSFVLTPKQLAAVQIMFDFHDTRSDSKKLKDLGIPGQTWQNWLQDPTFQEFVRTKAANLFNLNQHEIDRALFSKARQGNVEALKLALTLTGRLKEQEVPKIGNVEAHVFLMKLFEILQEALANQPDLLLAIGSKIFSMNDPYLAHPKVLEVLPHTEAPEKSND